MTASTPSSACRTESTLVMSPQETSAFLPSSLTLLRLRGEGRSNTLTWNPFFWSILQTVTPSLPAPPVTSTRMPPPWPSPLRAARTNDVNGLVTFGYTNCLHYTDSVTRCQYNWRAWKVTDSSHP